MMPASALSPVTRLTLLSLMLFASGCAGLTPREAGQAQKLREAGISETEMGTKNGWISGPLNIIPGVGNFYLATGKDSSSQIIYGILNIIPGWLLWPVTCAWSAARARLRATVVWQPRYQHRSGRTVCAGRRRQARRARSGQATGNPLPIEAGQCAAASAR